MALWRIIRPYLSWVVRFTHISYIETKSEHQGTWLGILWLPISSLVFSALLALVFRPSGSMGMADFFLYVLIGYTFWGFIAESVNGSTDIIQTRLEFAVHNNLSLAGLHIKLLIDRFFSYSLDFAVVLLMVVILRPGNFGVETLLLIPFVPLIAVASMGGGYLINLLTVFAPDTKVPIAVVTRLMFFVSPVFWLASEAREGPRQLLVNYNPVSYYLSLPRQAFGVEALDPRAWIVASACSILLGLGGYIAYVRSIGVVRNLK
jgi:ABC-type polysaccharide/polyol phosphate export permease